MSDPSLPKGNFVFCTGHREALKPEHGDRRYFAFGFAPKDVASSVESLKALVTDGAEAAPRGTLIPAPPPWCHDLKISPSNFTTVALDVKRFEIRKADRPYTVGDELRLREWDGMDYTGRECLRVVTHIYDQPEHGLLAGHVILSIGVKS